MIITQMTFWKLFQMVTSSKMSSIKIKMLLLCKFNRYRCVSMYVCTLLNVTVWANYVASIVCTKLFILGIVPAY